MIPAFLLKNPLASALGIGGAVVAIGLSVALGVQTIRLAHRDAQLATEKLAFANYKTEVARETARVEREARDKSDTAIKDLLRETRDIGAIASQAKTEVRLVQSNGGPCRIDPAYLSGIAGVQRVLGGQAAGGGGQGQARPGAAPAVRPANDARP